MQEQTAIQKLIHQATTRPDLFTNTQYLFDYCEYPLKVEKEQIVAAWVRGNELGWEQKTDWPSDAHKYYDKKYNAQKKA